MSVAEIFSNMAGNFNANINLGETALTSTNSVNYSFLSKFNIDEIFNLLVQTEPTNQFNTIIYPNPAQNHIIVESNNSNLSINIFNTNGNIIQSHQSTSNQHIINIENLPAGIYYLQCGYEIKRFIKINP